MIDVPLIQRLEDELAPFGYVLDRTRDGLRLRLDWWTRLEVDVSGSVPLLRARFGGTSAAASLRLNLLATLIVFACAVTADGGVMLGLLVFMASAWGWETIRWIRTERATDRVHAAWLRAREA